MSDAPDPSATEIREEMLSRVRGMPDEIYAEIYEERGAIRKGRRRFEAPSVLVDTAESNAVFLGLSDGRKLLEPVIDAVEAMSEPKTIERLVNEYDSRVNIARAGQETDE